MMAPSVAESSLSLPSSGDIRALDSEVTRAASVFEAMYMKWCNLRFKSTLIRRILVVSTGLLVLVYISTMSNKAHPMGKGSRMHGREKVLVFIPLLQHCGLKYLQRKLMGDIDLQRRRLAWVRAIRKTKFTRIKMARAEINELKKQIEKTSAALEGYERDGRVAQCRVRFARKDFREEIIKGGFDPTSRTFWDAFSSDEDFNDGSGSEDSESDA